MRGLSVKCVTMVGSRSKSTRDLFAWLHLKFAYTTVVERGGVETVLPLDTQDTLVMEKNMCRSG